MRFRICFLVMGITGCFFDALFGGSALHRFNEIEPVASFVGTRKYERVGYAMGAAGDVNNDGYDDFLIGTFHSGYRGHDAGAAYLVLGRPNFDWGQYCHLDNADARFLGKQSYDAVGSSVTGGDLNGDGYSDIIIGAPAGNPAAPDNPGWVYVVFGKKYANWGHDFVLARNANVKMMGELVGSEETLSGGLAGFQLRVIGDLNNDGCEELLVSAPFLDEGNEDSGKIYLIPGRKTGWPDSLLTAAVATFVVPQRKSAQLGFSMAALGDVNQDNVPDFAFGAPGSNIVYIIYGRADMNWGYNFNAQSANVIFSSDANNFAGVQVAGTGDTNGDGIPDILIGAAKHCKPHYRSGKVYVVHGRKGGWPSRFSLGNANATFLGDAEEDYFGWSADGVGDFDGDGLADCVAGMFNDPDRSKSGKICYIGGRTSNWPKEYKTANLDDQFEGDQEGQLTGFCVSRAGDVNGDGSDEFLVAAPYFSTSVVNRGRIYLFSNPPEQFHVQGRLTNYYNGTPLSDVPVRFESQESSENQTDEDGSFSFSCLENMACRIRPSQNVTVNFPDGTLSAYDAAQIARHQLGLAYLGAADSIAADVNQDGILNVLDAAAVLHYIVSGDNFPNTFTGEWAYLPCEYSVPAVAEDIENIRFEAVLLGNSDGHWPNGHSMIQYRQLARETVQHDLSVGSESVLKIPLTWNLADSVFCLTAKIKYDPELIQFEKVIGLEHLESVAWAEKSPGEVWLAVFSAAPEGLGDLFAEIQWRYCSTDLSASNEVQVLWQENNEEWQLEKHVLRFSDPELPQQFNLRQNYPNPFNGQTIFRYSLPENQRVEFTVSNLLGQTVWTHNQGFQMAGNHVFHWNAAGLPSGVYYFQIKTSEYTAVKRCVLLE